MRSSENDAIGRLRPGSAFFRLLGAVECTIDGRAVPIGHPRQRCVLAVLLVDVNRPVHAERLIDRVWGEQPPTNVRNVLSSYITRLRGVVKEIGDDRITLGRRSGGYSLDADPDRIDLHRFRDLVARARQADGPAAASLLADALALWQGPAFAGMDTPWCNSMRRTLDHERLRARLWRNDILLDAGQHAELLPELHELAEEHPLDERVAMQFMLALYRNGRQADALAACARTKSLLVTELGLDPGQELHRLEERILRNDTGLLRPPPAAAPAPAPAPLPVPQQLPAGTADFTGRDGEIDELDAVLADIGERGSSAVVISALDGMAGVGKTALAVHWAHRIKDRFPDGQLFVDLRGHARGSPSDPLRVLAQFLRALGVPPDRVPLDPDEAAAMYRTVLANRRALVVLDNARGPEQVRPLLPGTASCVTVITSRNQLGGLVARDGARQLSVGVLTERSARELVVRIIGEPRVAAEPQAVTELLRLCSQLPLALRIAAAKLANTPTERIADHVRLLRTGNRLDLLQVADDPDAVVRSAFTLSYAGLDDPARRLFRLLGAVPGASFGADLVAALTGRTVPEAVALLRVLSSAHLVEADGDRFRCHDLLRLFARERLDAEESPAERDLVLARLHAFYLRSVTAAADLLYPQMLRLPPADWPANARPVTFDDEDEAMAWLDTELANVLAVIAQGATLGDRRIAWQLADLLRGYFWRRRCTADWLGAAGDALRAAEADGDLMAQASAWLSSATAHWTISSLGTATEHYAHALPLARQIGWLEGEAAVLGNLASVHLERGQLDRAEQMYHQALELNTRHGRDSARAIDLNNLGNLYWELGALRKAERHFAQALAIHDTTGAPVPQANALLNLGSVRHDLGELASALDMLHEALALCRKIGDAADEATALEVIARVHLAAGRPRAALAEGQAALTRAREIGVRRIEAAALTTLGWVQHDLGHPAEAIDHHQQALDIGRAIDDQRAVTEALTGLAAVHLATGDAETALGHVDEALRVSRLAGYRVLVGRALTVRGDVQLRRGDLPGALDCARAALDIQRDAGDQLWAARSDELLGRVHGQLE